jgi:two-component system, chemotaxis family, sensor kinase CheA
MIQNEEFIQEFVQEAKSHVDNVESGLLRLNEDCSSAETINDIFRAVHSIKGSAGFFNLKKIVSLSHTFENIFGEVRNGSLAITSEMIDILLQTNDILKDMIDDVFKSEDADITDMELRLSGILTGTAKQAEHVTADHGKDKKTDSGSDRKGNTAKPEIKSEIKSVASIEVEQVSPAVPEPEATEEKPLVREDTAKISSAPQVEDSIRVNVTLLNSILNLTSEMVLGRNQLLRATEQHRKEISGIDAILQNIDHITTELQEKVMQTRMQPIDKVFSKFPRTIRDLSKKLNKDIELRLEGKEVELDKSIIEALGDPLTHLVRNAADHGLELPDVREKAGKPRQGTITLKAYHESGYVNIDIIDDGAGVNTERIKEKALEKRLISQSDAETLSEQELLSLLFKPGFSTVEKVTDLSGRGVGMDVVRTNIEKLGGTVEILTRQSKGTTFRLLLPLTLAIVPSLIVQVGGQRFALPQVNLQEIVRLKSGDATRKTEYVNNAEVLRLRGRLLPIVHLADALGIRRTFADPETNEIRTERRKYLVDARRKEAAIPVDSDRRLSDRNVIRILVLKIGSKRLGIAVDAILGSEEILVKPLPAYIKECKCFSGVTIMGDGKTALILDADGIIEKTRLRFTDNSGDKDQNKLDEEMESLREQQNLLLFRSSGSELLAVDLSMVSRVEEIKWEDIEQIGDKEYIRFRGAPLRLIRPEDFISIGKCEKAKDKLYVIIPKLVSNPMGILIREIHDTLQTYVKLASDNIQSDCLIGSAIINDKITLLIDIYELFEKADPEQHKKISLPNAERKFTILIAEDTPFFLKLEKDYIENAGYKVVSSMNGREALQILKEQHIDVLVSDIQMPVMDGLELIKRVRNEEALSSIPAIAVTSLSGEHQMKEGMDAGFDFYQSKLDKVKLLEDIESALRLKRRGA